MKNYKFWGEFKLRSAPETPAVKQKQANPKMTSHLLKQVFAHKINDKVTKEANNQNVQFESPYGKLDKVYNKFVGKSVIKNMLGHSRSEQAIPKV